MAVFTALTDDYGHAKNLISLLKTEGIEASITGGGVMVLPKPQDIIKARTICKRSGAFFVSGYADDDTSNVAKKVSGDARSVLKEWE